MKKIVFFAFSLLIGFNLSAQKLSLDEALSIINQEKPFPIEDGQLFYQTVIYLQDTSLTTNTVFSKCKQFLAESFNDSRNVTHLADKDDGTIIIKYIQTVKPYQTFMYSGWNYETKIQLKIEIKDNPTGGVKVRMTHNSEKNIRIWSFYDGELNEFEGDYSTFYPLGDRVIYNTKNWKVAQILGLSNSITEFKKTSLLFQNKISNINNLKQDEW